MSRTNNVAFRKVREENCLRSYWEETWYNENGSILKYDDSDGFSSQRMYDDNNNNTSYTDNTGFEYKAFYDDNSNVLFTYDNEGNWKHFNYDDNMNLVLIIGSKKTDDQQTAL